ncbi:MAG TPA: SRPBCC domain-containing protein [Acidimicrobiales bacterium]|nr:SRPBCC domain-containing protein [Acidimicrobiales bacterium]
MDDHSTPARPDPVEPPPGHHTPSREIIRDVEVDAGTGEVWRVVSDPAERARWLDDPDARARRVRVDESRPGERLVWTWWHPGDEEEASTVTVVLRPVVGGTRVVVTEVRPAAVPVARASVGPPVGGGARCPGSRRCRAGRGGCAAGRLAPTAGRSPRRPSCSRGRRAAGAPDPEPRVGAGAGRA